MACILKLSNELLLYIASKLEDDSQSLHHFSLVCKALFPIAQETLYTSPSLCPSSKNMPSKVYHFLMILLSRPDLAARVKELKIACQRRDINHRPDCIRERILGAPNVCKCGTTRTMTMAKEHLENLGVNTTGWDSWIGLNREPSLVGIILYLLPNLRELAIYSIGAFRTKSEAYRYLQIGSFESFNYFGERSSSQIVGPALGRARTIGEYKTIPGLANLTSITANDLLPLKMLELPSLRRVEFGWDISNQRHSPHEGMDPSNSWSPSPSISELIIHADATMIENNDNSMLERRRFLEILTSRLPALRSLSLYIVQPYGDHPYWAAGVPDWNDLIVSVRGAAHTLEELLISDESSEGDLKVIHFMDLSPFRKLKRIAAPERAFTQWPEKGCMELSTLSPSIETIEVQCLTNESNDLANMLLDTRQQIPNCKNIIFHIRKGNKLAHEELEVRFNILKVREAFKSAGIEFIEKVSKMRYKDMEG